MSSRLVHGCMTLGGSWDDAPWIPAPWTARSAVHAVLDAGITDFDHADIYAHGKSEEAFGEQQILANHPEAARHPFPEGILEHCATHGIEVQDWEPPARDRYTGAPVPHGNRAAAVTAETVRRIAAAHGVPGEAVVLAWLMRHPGGIRPVIGTTDPERIAACAEAQALVPPLGHEDRYALLEAARGHPVP